jgi:hypothetical protein
LYGVDMRLALTFGKRIGFIPDIDKTHGLAR